MSFIKVNINDTRFYDLVSSIDIEERRIPEKDRKSLFDWPCAFDEERDVIFTQLESNTWEMREWMVWYLMFVGEDPIFIYWTLGSDAKFLEQGAISKYDHDYLIKLTNDASIVGIDRNKPIFRVKNA